MTPSYVAELSIRRQSVIQQFWIFYARVRSLYTISTYLFITYVLVQNTLRIL